MSSALMSCPMVLAVRKSKAGCSSSGTISPVVMKVESLGVKVDAFTCSRSSQMEWFAGSPDRLKYEWLVILTTVALSVAAS